MNIESELKKEGIYVVSRIDTLTANTIAKNVARRISESFPELEIDESILFSKFARLNLYKAKMPEGMAEASYFYRNQSIYFNENIDDEDLEEFAIHEYIHHLQERLDSKQNIRRMGLCNYINSRPIGLALDEAATQFTASHIIGIEPDFEKYYDISLFTPSPSYYPLECALLNEILYFTGKDVLYKSTLYSLNDFRDEVIRLSSKETYDILETYFDNLLKLEEEVIKINNKINSLADGSSKVSRLTIKLKNSRQKVTDMFFAIQSLIIKDFFNTEFNKISTLEDLEHFRHKLINIKDLLGKNNEYPFFEDFYKETMNKLEHKCNILENGGIETAVVVKTENTAISIFRKLFNFFFKPKESEY